MESITFGKNEVYQTFAGVVDADRASAIPEAGIIWQSKTTRVVPPMVAFRFTVLDCLAYAHQISVHIYLFVKADFERAVGRRITVEASRARDGSLSGLIRQVTLTD